MRAAVVGVVRPRRHRARARTSARCARGRRPGSRRAAGRGSTTRRAARGRTGTGAAGSGSSPWSRCRRTRRCRRRRRCAAARRARRPARRDRRRRRSTASSSSSGCDADPRDGVGVHEAGVQVADALLVGAARASTPVARSCPPAASVMRSRTCSSARSASNRNAPSVARSAGISWSANQRPLTWPNRSSWGRASASTYVRSIPDLMASTVTPPSFQTCAWPGVARQVPSRPCLTSPPRSARRLGTGCSPASASVRRCSVWCRWSPSCWRR